MSTFPGRVGLLQRVLPAYRVPLFDTLAAACAGGLGIFAGEPRPDEAIQTTTQFDRAVYTPAQNMHFFNGRFYLCYQSGWRAWLENWNPDALIVEANPRYLSTPAVVDWMHARRRPVIGWGLGSPPLSGALAGVRTTARRRFLNRLDAIVAYSRRGVAEYQALGFPAERVFVAHNAAAPRPTQPPPTRPPTFNGPPNVLFVGRLQARKRIDLLLQACAALPENLQPALTIVGDGPARAEFETQAAQIYPRAQFAGPRFGTELEQYFAEADLFVLPGTGGLAIQQAVANALPVIVAEGDGTQDDLVRPQNGWLLPPDDLEALTAALQSALAAPQRLRTMGRESYRIAAEEINLEAMVAVFVSVLNQLAGGGN
jgi:glycosyltransferase involved in cell wall biosynthesis